MLPMKSPPISTAFEHGAGELRPPASTNPVRSNAATNIVPLSPGKAEGLDLTNLKRLIWAYFWLLILEGALRKWVLPGLANPLLIIRDPVVLLIYATAASQGIFPRTAFIPWIVVLAIVSTGVSLVAGHGSLFITLYGVRTDFLHLPLLFLLPNVFSTQDVQRIGKWLLLTALPMALLVAAQFKASPDSRLNVGVGGSVGGQIGVGFDKIRPPGTFSFTGGLVAFVALTAAYLLSTQMRKESANGKLALVTLPAVAIMVAVSGSRASLGAVVIILGGVMVSCIRKPVLFGKAAKGLIVIAAVYFGLSFWSEFRTGLMVHESRITNGGGFEQGVALRLLGDFLAPFTAIADTPFFGEGLGMGTNAASGVLHGERGFLLAEGEWERNVRESGPIIGFFYIGLRIAILTYIARRALFALNREDPLPLLIFCATMPLLLNGQFGVPTTLGFAVFGGGWCLAAAEKACRREVGKVAASVPGMLAPATAQSPVRKVRGRSIYAEQLHGE